MSARKVVMRVVSISFSILVIVLVIFALAKLGEYAYQFGYRVFTEEPISTEEGSDVIVRIENDMDEVDIGNLLEEKGLVRDGTLFLAQLKLSSYSNKLKPGVYTLNTSMTAKEMMQVMSPAEKETETEGVKQSERKQETESESGTER
jgi:UPF0755 protein